jgi:hypothetical protein
MELRGEALEPPYRLCITVSPNSNIMRIVSHIDACCVWVHYLQTWIFGSQPPRQFFPLPSISL